MYVLLSTCNGFTWTAACQQNILKSVTDGQQLPTLLRQDLPNIQIYCAYRQNCTQTLLYGN